MDWDYIATKFSCTPDRLLFHYTDVNGLEGIINNQEIWAADHGYLNDTSEFNNGTDVFKVLVGSGKYRNHNLFNKRFDHQEDFVEVINSVSRKAGDYCCSFTPNGDVLSQWRGYCPKTGGYSIGFSVESLKKLSEGPNFKFYRCFYEKNDQQNIAISVIDEFLYFIEHTEKTYDIGKDGFQTHLKRAVSNALLVMQQRPDATLVLSEKRWEKQFQRSLRQGVQPIVIMKILG